MIDREHLNKGDLALILEVNKKAVEIEGEVADQNEIIIDKLEKIQEIEDKVDKKLEKVIEQNDELSKSIYRIQVLFIVGLLGIVGQLIQIFFHK